MPSKTEIKKSPKPARSKVSKSVKATTGKKSAAKKVVRTNGADKSVSEVKKPSTRIGRTLKTKIHLSVTKQPTVEQITLRAHQMWLDEGCPEGRAQIHWQLAESELSAR